MSIWLLIDDITSPRKHSLYSQLLSSCFYYAAFESLGVSRIGVSTGD